MPEQDQSAVSHRSSFKRFRYLYHLGSRAPGDTGAAAQDDRPATTHQTQPEGGALQHPGVVDAAPTVGSLGDVDHP